MKRLLFSLTAVVAAALCALSCTQEIEGDGLNGCEKARQLLSSQEILITATAPDAEPETKTARFDTKFYWAVGDKISIFYGPGDQGGSCFTSTHTIQDGDDGHEGYVRRTTFRGYIEVITGLAEGSDDIKFWGIFPYRSDNACVDDGAAVVTTIKSSQNTDYNSWGNSQSVCIGRSDGLVMGFYNLCGGIMFKLSQDRTLDRISFRGNNNETVAGQVKVVMDSKNEPVISEFITQQKEIILWAPDGFIPSGATTGDIWYYLILPPCTFSKGFTITLYDDYNEQYAQYVETRSRTIKRNVFGKYGTAIDDGLTFTSTAVWGVVGGFNDWGGTNGDLLMEQTSPGIWVSPAFTVPHGTYGFKIRKDYQWEVDYGGSFVDFGVPFAAEASGPNLLQDETEDHTVRLTLDLTDHSNPMITIDSTAVWSVIGGFNGWGDDLDMTETSLGIWESPEFTPDIQGFKLRFNKDWEGNLGGTFSDYGSPIQGVLLGNSIMENVGDGSSVKVRLDLTDSANPMITVFEVVPPDVWSVIGEFNNWSSDVDMTETSPGIWKSPAFVIPDGGYGFKVRMNHGWDMSLGGSFPGFGVSFEAEIQGGDNIVVGESGKEYKISVTLDLTDPEQPLLTINDEREGWCMIGSFSYWDEDVLMEEIQPGKWKGTLVGMEAGTQFKFRLNHNWETNLGADSTDLMTIVTPGTPLALASNGGNLGFDTAGSYEVLLDLTGTNPVATFTLMP